MVRRSIRKAVPLSCLILALPLYSQTLPPDIPALEKRADTEYNNRNCAAAEKTYAELLPAVLATGEIKKTSLYYFRIGNCRTRVGDFSASLEAYRKGIALGESIGDDDIIAAHIHGASLQLMKLGRGDEALPLGQREYELAQKSGRPTQIVRAMWLLAAQDKMMGRIRDEVRLLNDALAISRKTTDTPTTGVLLQSLAIDYLTLGDPETAEHFQKELLALPLSQITSMATTTSLGTIYSNLGEIQLKAGHPADARKSFELAVQASNAPEDWRVHIDALLNLATSLNKAGQIAEADESFRQAIEHAHSVNFPDLQTAAWQMQSDALLVRGDVQGALRAGEESMTIARKMDSADRIFKASLSLGAAKAAAGDRAAAKALFDEGLRLGELSRAQSPGEVSDLTRAFQLLLPFYQASVANLMEMKLASEALERAEQAKARVLMDILLRGGVNERDVLSRSERAEQERLRKRITPGNADSMVEFRQFRRTLYEKHPELAVQSTEFAPVRADQLSALAPHPETALLDFFTVPEGIALFVVRRGTGGTPKISAFCIPDPKHTLAAEARAFRQRLANRDLDYKHAARHLFNRLLAPAMADLRGSTDWVISPDGALWEIPFEALIDADGKHIIETRSISLTPSLTTALQIHDRKREVNRTALQFLAFGNPLPSPVPLPDAVREVTDIGASYPPGSAVLLTGTAASLAEFQARSPSARVIHLAAHAGLNDSDPLSSFVRLSNGEQLTALSIMSLRLRANLVVLSACETALGNIGAGEGMIGMGWALSAAGVSSSVLSLWKVDSTASRDFMISFYRNPSVPKAEALRKAELEMLQSPDRRHPFYWAAFTLQGDGSSPFLQ